MNYINALSIIQRLNPKKKQSIKILSSFNSDPLDIFLRAIFGKKDVELNIKKNQFNTLKQSLINNSGDDNLLNIIIILPWDFFDGFNWRSGINHEYNHFYQVKKSIDEFVGFLINAKEKNYKIIYVDLPIPNFFLNTNEYYQTIKYLHECAKSVSDMIIKRKKFSLDRFIDIGLPFETNELFKISKAISNTIKSKIKKISFKNKKIRLKKKQKNLELKSKKILALDFDGTLWGGNIADDGTDGIRCGNDIQGYKYWIFQNLIKRLKKRGILIVGVTRNNLKFAKSGFKNKNCQLKASDFLNIYASYDSKSINLKKAYTSINLSEDSVVFVDDNIIELAEVKKNTPKIKSLLFPSNLDEIPKFLNNISKLFQKNNLTKEDVLRVKNYKSNLKINLRIKNKIDINLDSFLKTLKMKLFISQKDSHNKTDLARPFQLINKTNQFNLNGRRISKNFLTKLLNDGGKLFTGSYKDNNGDFGEIICILIDKHKNVISFVMSCRVFQRNIEYVFLRELIKSGIIIKRLNFKKTEKNDPFFDFIKDLRKYLDKKNNLINLGQLLKNFSSRSKLFALNKIK